MYRVTMFGREWMPMDLQNITNVALVASPLLLIVHVSGSQINQGGI